MDYATARNQIQDGDLILEKGRKGLFAWLTKIVTRSEYTHAAVAVWLQGGLYIAEINGGGNHLVPLSQITQAFDVFRPAGLWPDTREVILNSLRDKVSYSILDAFTIGLRDLFSLRLPVSRNGLVCSQYAFIVLRDAGWGYWGCPELPSPADLAMQFPDGPLLEVTQ